METDRRYKWNEAGYKQLKWRHENGESWEQISKSFPHQNYRSLRNQFRILRKRFSPTPPTKGRWTQEEDEILKTGRMSGETFKKISSRLNNRTVKACESRFLRPRRNKRRGNNR